MPSGSAELVRVAAVQAAPVFLDRAASLQKACALVRKAAAGGAGLVAFGENFLPGHPIWFHALPPTDGRSRALATSMVNNAVTVPGPESDLLRETARDTKTMVIVGVVERPDPRVSVIFDSQLVIAPNGDLLGIRRKLVPAVGERVFFGAGDAESIRVFESPWGPVSVLAGGENSNPLLTYAMRDLGARIHVALWPPHFHAPGVMHNVVSITGRAVAYQNSAHVISVAAASDPAAVSEVCESGDHRANLEEMTRDPGSMIYAPRGKALAGPLRGEGILYADIDPTTGTWAQLVNRQYDRPDLLRLTLTSQTGEPSTRPPIEETGADPLLEDERRSQLARRLIEDRFGGALGGDDVEALIPYVVQTLRRSDRLADRDLSSADPRTTPNAGGPSPTARG